VASIYGFGLVKKSFFPASTRPQFMVHYWLPQGTHITNTEADLKAIERHLMTIDGITDVSTFVGQGPLRFLLTLTPENANSAYGMLLVGVEDYRKIDDLVPVVQHYIEENYPNAQAFSRKFVLGPGEPQKIQVRFRGPDPDVLRLLAKKARNIMVNDPEVVDVVDDWRQRVPLIVPVVAESQARNAGITRSDIAKALQMAFGGTQIGVFREGDNLLPIVARSPENERTEVDNLKDVQIWSPVAQKTIPLTQDKTGFETRS
ncbi:MAG: efflux RND transporter permease subunit, partial [Candidatus Hydrogenedentota bacterium]